MVNLLRINNKKAVTLTEILVAVVMLAVAGLPIFGLLNFSAKGTREQSAEAEAGNLAKEEMNRLMYVEKFDDLLVNAGQDIPCKFAEGKDKVVRKGNEFIGFYTIYKVPNSLINFTVPKMKFHKPQDCSVGSLETHNNVVEGSEDVNIVDLIDPDKKNNTFLVDIYLEIQWKLPADKAYSEKNKLILYGRRYNYVE